VRFRRTPIDGAWIIDPEPRSDSRGYFARAWCVDELAARGIEFVPVQANMVFSHDAGTLRGMHYQVAPHREAKLVRCTRGSVFDVVVDLREGSETFGSWWGTELTAENGRMVYVPPECAHACQSLTDRSEIYYLASARYAAECVRGLRFDDPTVGVQWPLPPTNLSEQDRRWPLLGREEAIAL
jgi:dTDP-4-dehydrorhamnose 3,5-epimerase